MDDVKEKSYLKLSAEPVRFEPVSKVTSVFFDDTNKEVLSVRGGGTLGVVVKGKGKTQTFCMENRGTISSLKFSPDHSILAVQYTSTSVELLMYSNGEVSAGVVQECRTKGAKLQGFIWCTSDEILLVTDLAIEMYQVQKQKMSLKFQKSHTQNCHWFAWSPECSLLVLCTQQGVTCSTLQSFSVMPGQLNKQSKFEVEASVMAGSEGSSNGTVTLSDRDVSLGRIYNSIALCILRHPSSPTVPAHLDVYIQNKDGSFRRSYMCRLELTGRFAVNIIDNVIVVHHQASKSSLLFDIYLGREVSNGVTSVYPLTLPKSIESFYLEEPSAMPSSSITRMSIPCPLYTPTWVVFQPDIIIDARLGCMWTLELVLEELLPLIEDKAELADCLLRRTQAKPLVLCVVRSLIESRQLGSLGVIFDKINTLYRQHLNAVLQSQMGECVSGKSAVTNTQTVYGVVIIEQAELYSNVFAPLMDKAEDLQKTDVPKEGPIMTNLMVGVVLEYVQSLGSYGIPVQHFMYDLIINGLVRTKQFYQLHQLLQYHVLADSKPLACLLLSLVGVYSAGLQLSLDMLSRLNSTHEEIAEVLLSQGQVTEALRYARSVGMAETISARKFLESAKGHPDPKIFYSTFMFFSQRNATLRGSAAFVKGENCDTYVEHFRKLFGEPPDVSSYQ